MDGWRDGFLAMSLALGDSLEVAAAALVDPPNQVDTAETRLLRDLRSADKRTRAHALARGLALIALAMESLQVEVTP